jgi:hypothetical protein
MQHQRRLAACAVTGLLLTAACAPDSGPEPLAPTVQPSLTMDGVDPSADGVGPSASGHANMTQAPGVLRTFSFTARQMPDGTVEGKYTNHNRLGGIVNHGDIDCLMLLPPNGAVLSGPIRKHTLGEEFEGRRIVIRVEDNGEGADDPPDRVGFLVNLPAGSELDCRTFLPQTMFPVEAGNIQIRP